jgi:RND superfamily putative drug exporter
MLGLAVGIDYSLLIVSRHRSQLRQGADPQESTARALATAGSSVIFAGLTVVIALLGLAVARIPFLTIMGVGAACAVLVAVVVAVTVTPALLGLAGGRLRPKERAKKRSARSGKAVKDRRASDVWADLNTRHPAVTIANILVILGVLAVPALSLRLALPDGSSEPVGSMASETYDVLAEEFGPGANGPLIVTGTITGSTDPLGLMEDLRMEFEAMEGVAAVPVATPNATADTGLLQIIPTSAPDAEQTEQLVTDIRARHDEWKERYGVDLSVTGATAVGIDISGRLAGALVPFGAVVVGLSFVLLTIAFRSLWVPLVAAAGFVLSVGASFGVVTAVFQWGWGSGVLNISKVGPIISFMPILLIGVLFGLAMDYVVFLVSRMREELVHGTPSRRAVRRGFTASAGVVTAAALIMFAVFTGFVPQGGMPIKTIGFGLAVGVFIDAFLVRMTLLPAVLHLLGDRAWRIPRWLDRVLPNLDIEGEKLAR